MQRLRGIELPEVAGLVGDEYEISVAGVARDIPVLPACSADMRDVLKLHGRMAGDGNQVDDKALVDQKTSQHRRWRRAAGCSEAPAADRAVGACTAVRAADTRRHRRAPAGSSRP
jgi:hypothetical protein